MVTVLSVGYAVWATYTVAQQDGSAADLIAPVITAIAQCLLLISYNSFVLNIETTSLITLNGLVENAKATYGNSDKYVQGALAFLISPYGERSCLARLPP